MDFTFSEEQNILRESARKFVESQCGPEYIKQFVDGKREFDETLWKAMAGLGWAGVLIPEEQGGAGLGFVELGVVLEEMGKGPMPGPFVSTVVMAAEAIRIAGTPKQRQAFLPRVASGELTGTLAWAEPDGLYNTKGLKTIARAERDGFVLNGTKLFVTDGASADLLICAAASESGTSLFVIDRKAPGLKITPVPAMDRTMNLSEVVLDGVAVSGDALLGREGEAKGTLKQLMNRINVAYALDMVGGGQRILEIGVEYAKTRVQFGQPIGSFQAIKHKCADILMEVEGARSISYYAAWAQGEEGEEATASASAAKAFCSEMYRRAAKEVLQILGAIGFTWEHETHIYLKRAQSLGSLFGDATFHRERLAQELGY